MSDAAANGGGGGFLQGMGGFVDPGAARAAAASVPDQSGSANSVVSDYKPPATRMRMSDMGNAHVEVPSQGRLQPLDPEPQQQPAEVEQHELAEQQPEVEQQVDEQPDEQQEEQPQDDWGKMSPEQRLAKAQEWRESPDLPDEFYDKTIWLDLKDGNGPQPFHGQADLAQHVMRHRDYQKKTTEVARLREEVQQKDRGYASLEADLRDPTAAIKAVRFLGGPESVRAIAMSYIAEQATLEVLPENMRADYMAGIEAREEAERFKRREKAREAEAQRRAEAEAQAQGSNAPDIQYVQKHVDKRIPELMREMGIAESDALSEELSAELFKAVKGERSADGQRWKTPPKLLRGRTPADAVLREILVNANQRMLSKFSQVFPGRQPRQLPPAAAGRVTGPAARPGTRGSIGQPERRRFSDMHQPRGR